MFNRQFVMVMFREVGQLSSKQYSRKDQKNKHTLCSLSNQETMKTALLADNTVLPTEVGRGSPQEPS